jgi:Zn-dependent peptidase ImmA (M78 family)
MFDALAELVDGEGYELEVRPSIGSDGGAHGWTSREKQLIWINGECDEAERIRILTHELAHQVRPLRP